MEFWPERFVIFSNRVVTPNGVKPAAIYIIDGKIVHVMAFQEKLTAASGKLWVDCGFYGGIVPGNYDQIELLIQAGVFCRIISAFTDKRIERIYYEAQDF